MFSKYLLLFLATFIFLSTAKAQSFGAEQDIKRRAKIPAGILKILEKTERVRSCLKRELSGGKETFNASWFQAARVDLNGDRFTDYVVKPEYACLFGANIVPFWVFRGTAKGFEKVFEDYVLGLSINKRKKTRGFYNIETFAATAVTGTTVFWVFDGRRYKLKSSKTSEL